MKGCVVLIRESATLLHEIVWKLHTTHGMGGFCAYEQNEGMEEYAKSQNNVPYTFVLKESVLYREAKKEKINSKLLEDFEKKYGKPTLWQYLLGEKTIMLTSPAKVFFSYEPQFTHEEMLKIVQVFFKKIEEFLQKEKPDFLLTAGIGSLGTHALFAVAKNLGIKTLDIQTARIGDKFIITEDFTRFTGVEKIFEKIRSGKYSSPYHQEAEKFLSDFRNRPKPYFPVFIHFGKDARLKFLKPENLLRSLKMIVNITKIYFKLIFTDQHPINPLRFVWESLIKKTRSFIISSFYENPRYDEPYAFLPLQMEPEVGNTILSPYYTNYIELARLIAKSLPVNFKLYVKEHPVMRGIRKTSYYKKLKQIPNVRIINDAVPGTELIKSSRMVFTNTSTVGWEAVLLGKPVISFGNIFYNRLSCVKKCTDPETLPLVIKDVLANFKPDHKEITDFVSAIFEDSVSFDFAPIINLDSDQGASEIIKNSGGFDEMVKLIASKLV